MPITFQQPSPQVAEQTRSALQDMAQQKQFRIAPLAASTPSQISVTSPHAVYNIDLDEIVENKPLSAAQFTAWRFIVASNPSQPAAAEMHGDPNGDHASFSSVNDGPFVAGTIAAFKSVAEDPAFATGDWEGRLLRIPALFVMAVWIHNKTTGEDMLRPIAPTPNFLNANTTYTWPQFLEALEGPARGRLSSDDRPRY
jgi:hypothetical protein